jgi:hypothetical protein
MARFTYIWEFYVAPSAQAQFEFEYGPYGSWVTLFRSSPGHIETLLLHDHADPLRYVTVDRWDGEKELSTEKLARV